MSRVFPWQAERCFDTLTLRFDSSRGRVLVMPGSRTGSRGASPVGFETVGSEPIALSEITTLTSLTDSLLSDYDALVARSSTGLRSCKEVHAFLKERSAIEATYGNALVRQARASAGSLERGTCRMGWFAFKSMSESIGRKHLVRPPPAAAPRLALCSSHHCGSSPFHHPGAGAGLPLQRRLHGAAVPA